MHIPDGYLSPQTAVPLIAVMVPVLGVAANKIKNEMKKKEVPVLAAGAAFSFVIMMFNLPIPGGSSAHAVGAVLLAILLGPWAACLGVSVALIIQAIIFGDGGILALGANCFNIAFIMSFVGYYTYKIIKGRAEKLSPRGMAAAFIGAYIGLNVAALSTALMFGAQYHAAMMSEHLILAGPVEGVVSVLGLWFVGKNYPALLAEGSSWKVREDKGAETYV